VLVKLVPCPTTFESKDTETDPIQSFSKAGCSGSDFGIVFQPADANDLAVKQVKVGQ